MAPEPFQTAKTACFSLLGLGRAVDFYKENRYDNMVLVYILRSCPHEAAAASDTTWRFFALEDGRSWYLPILILLTVLCAFVFAGISAMVGVNDMTLKERVDRGEPRARRLYGLLHSSSGFIDNARTMGWLLAVSAAVVAAIWQAEVYEEKLLSAVGDQWAAVLACLLTVLATVLVLVTFAVKVPQLLGNRFCERLGYAAAGPMQVLYWIFSPLCLLIRAVARLVGRLFGADPVQTDESVTKEEIRMLVDAGNEMGFIEESQKEMINNIFEFDDTTAGEVMTHRTEIVAVEKDAKISEVVYLAINEGFSRLPVYEKDMDNILGLIYVKDLLCLVGCNSSEDFKVADFIRPVMYVPESVKCRALFAEFKKQKAHMAIVVDEYGGTAGLVSMEDVLESIVGDIEDEYDKQEEEVQQIAEDTYILEGTIDLEDVGSLTGLDFAEEEDEDLDTLGGFLIHRLGHIPDKDENPQIIHGGWRFTVLTMDERRIDKVKMQRLSGPAAEDEEKE